MSDLALFVQTACVWEATARKPGNVHRYADFEDTHYLDFIFSAAAAAPAVAQAAPLGVGRSILEAIRATRRVTRANTNLGMILLLAPLAAVPAGSDVRDGIGAVLARLSVDDTRAVYAAIRLTAPGGLGSATEQDVAEEPTIPLRDAMSLAADRDLVARQYANGFREVFEVGLPALKDACRDTGSLESAIIRTHLTLMAMHPDTLIARKCGRLVAEEASARVRRALAAGDWRELDAWLRADGHRRNPGTTADLVAAVLFAALRLGILTLPPTLPW